MSLEFVLLIGAILLGFSGLFFSVFLLQFPLGVLMLLVSFVLLIFSLYGFVHGQTSISPNPATVDIGSLSDVPSRPIPTLYCDHCGILIPVDSKYCDHCGKPNNMLKAVNDAVIEPSVLPSSQIPTLHCDRCGTLLPKDFKYCDHCGTPNAQIPTLHCGDCETVLPVDFAYCDHCGARLSR